MKNLPIIRTGVFFILSIHATEYEYTPLLPSITVVGNKNFTQTQMQAMTQEQQDLLYQTAHPFCCYRWYGVDGKNVIAEHQYQLLKKHENMKDLKIKRIKLYEAGLTQGL